MAAFGLDEAALGKDPEEVFQLLEKLGEGYVIVLCPADACLPLWFAHGWGQGVRVCVQRAAQRLGSSGGHQASARRVGSPGISPYCFALPQPVSLATCVGSDSPEKNG